MSVGRSQINLSQLSNKNALTDAYQSDSISSAIIPCSHSRQKYSRRFDFDFNSLSAEKMLYPNEKQWDKKYWKLDGVIR